MTRLRLSEVLAIFGILGILAAILFPVFAQSKGSKRSACLNNLKQLGRGEIQYASDFDDRFSPRDAWMDATRPYVKNLGAYHCPQAAKGTWGYAFNGALDRAKAPQDASAPLIYDSVNPGRNASDLVASLPSPGRHAGLDRLVRVDGSARSLRVP